MTTDEVLSYEQRLAGHVDQYVGAVMDNPGVRHAEFATLHAVAGLTSPARILEFSAEGRMLERFYPQAIIDRADLLDIGGEGAPSVLRTSWDMAGVTSSHYDAVLSIVPVHHATEAEKLDYLQGALRVLRPGGVLAFAEVEEGSIVHAFLDGFVHEHSRAGHRGAYLTAAFVERMRSAGFNQVSTSLEPVSWHFACEADMCAFMTRIFALDAMPAHELLNVLRSQLGVSAGEGGLRLHWPLRYFRGCAPC